MGRFLAGNHGAVRYQVDRSGAQWAGSRGGRDGRDNKWPGIWIAENGHFRAAVSRLGDINDDAAPSRGSPRFP